jgi:flagellar hook-basal body complex protein FliE
MNPVNNISGASIPLGAPALGRTESSPSGSAFKEVLLRSIQEVSSMQQAADRAVEALSSGEDVSAAEVLTAVQKADVAFRLMMQIRNKVVQAYQEVQNIRV